MNAVFTGEMIIGAILFSAFEVSHEHRPENVGEPDLFLLRDADIDVAKFAETQIQRFFGSLRVGRPKRARADATRGSEHDARARSFKIFYDFRLVIAIPLPVGFVIR